MSMKVYCVHYTCPHCKHPTCGVDPNKRANELVPAKNKAEARQRFNQHKHCRHMKVCLIQETTCSC